MSKKAVCIVSGGMDSVTLLHKAVKELGKENVSVLNFHYGSKHNNRERPFAKLNAKLLGVKYTEINLDYINKLWKSDLLKSGGKIPEGHYAQDNMKLTVVPFRNGIMLANAVGFAESIGFNEVWLGSHKGDRAQYKDCSKEFTKAMSKAAEIGTDKGIKILSPFNNIMKSDIVKIGVELKVPYEKTFSCYVGEKRPCLRCGTDVERTEAFYKNNIKDPLLTIKEWEIAVSYMKKTLKEFDKKQKVKI